MRKRQLKKLNDALLNNTEVSDSVLDKAREEIKKQQYIEASTSQSSQKQVKFPKPQNENGTAITINKRGIACAIGAILVICLITMSIVFIVKNNSGIDMNEGNSYSVSELEKKEIMSIESYNEANGKSYLYFDGDDSTYSLYSHESTVVLLEQNFLYQDCDCVWYIVVNDKDYIDILSCFEDLQFSTQINDHVVYYNFDNNIQYAEIYDSGSKYCLMTKTEDTQLIFNVLNLILN